MSELLKHSKIFVAGHNGMVGSAIVRELKKQGYSNVVVKKRSELNLLCQESVNLFLEIEKPDYIFLAAAKVGGILANDIYRADFIYQNTMIEANVIHGAHVANIQRLCFLGSSCIYPRDCPQPIKEEYLLSGKLERTNEPYAIAKILGIKMCESYNEQYGREYISLMPTNLYGPNDNYDLNSSHVLPALIRKVCEAKKNGINEITLWGSGAARREFLYVDDLAEACVFLMKTGYSGPLINVGTGEDLTILKLAEIIMSRAGLTGEIKLDLTKQDGTPRKLLDVSKINELGWTANTSLIEGIDKVLEHYKKYDA